MDYKINGNRIEFDWPHYIAPFSKYPSPACDKKLIGECDQYFCEKLNLPTGSFKSNLTPIYLYQSCTDRAKMKVMLDHFNFLYWQDDNQDDVEENSDQNKLKIKVYKKIISIGKAISLNEDFDFDSFETSPDITGFHKCIVKGILEFCKSYTFNQRKRLFKVLKRYYEDYIGECELYINKKNMDELKPLLFEVKM